MAHRIMDWIVQSLAWCPPAQSLAAWAADALLRKLEGWR
jgi:hypothetical protein